MAAGETGSLQLPASFLVERPAVKDAPVEMLVGPPSAKEMSAGASLAEEYFLPAAKRRRKVCATRGFAAAILQKAPSKLESCRSLLLFVEKKLEAPLSAAPVVGGPEDLRAELERQADAAGRLAGLRATSGWDARARRVLDLTATAASTHGQLVLLTAQESIEKQASELGQQLKERGERGVEVLTKERQSWAQGASLHRNWLAWCARLLQAREAHLLAGTKVAGSDDEEKIGDVEILEALLAGVNP